MLLNKYFCGKNKNWKTYNESVSVLGTPFLPCCSVAKSCQTLCDSMDYSQASLSSTISLNLLRLTSIELVMPSNHLILYRPLLLLTLNFPSIRVFSMVLTLCIRWPKYWSFSFSISPSSEYSGLISFRTDWFDRLGVQGALKSLWKSSKNFTKLFEDRNYKIIHLWSFTTSRRLRFYSPMRKLNPGKV